MRDREVLDFVPMPHYDLMIPQSGTVWLRGKLTPPVDQFKLDSHLLPPGLYKTVRDDLARYSTIPVSRVALRKNNNVYEGIIDSNGDPYLFILGTAGIAVHKAENDDDAWKWFDALISIEQKAGLQLQRKHSAQAVSDFFDVTHDSVTKALPSKDRSDSTGRAKKTRSKKVAAKKVGKNGKTRYNYPQDKQQASKKKPGADKNGPQRVAEKTQKEELTGADPIAVPREPTPKRVNPQHVANQLQMPVHTLKHIAKRFSNNPKLKGRSGFISFMKVHLRAFAEKHKLDGDFFGLLYDALVGTKPTVATKL